MKFYKQVQADVIHWSVSQTEASAKRAEWVKSGVKRADISTIEVDVPTDKKGLQEFLNSGR